MTTPSISLDIAPVSGGLLIARLVLGLGMAAHGAQKLFGWFGGYGLEGTGGFLEKLGFRPGKAFAAVSGLNEFTSGVLVALGFLGPVGPALMISGMIVAIAAVHWHNGFFSTDNGFELPLIYATGALALAFIGFGQYSADAVLGLAGLATPALTAVVIALGVLGAVVMLALRRPVAKPVEAHS
jgi:putative oxidoreductase